MREATSAIISHAITAAIAVAGGALGGLIYSRSNELPQQVRVVDMRRLVEAIAQDPTLDEAGRRARTEEVSNAISKLVTEQAARGAIVLDGSAVLRAPAQVYVEAQRHE